MGELKEVIKKGTIAPLSIMDVNQVNWVQR
jgi:hypothetical protein